MNNELRVMQSPFGVRYREDGYTAVLIWFNPVDTGYIWDGAGISPDQMIDLPLNWLPVPIV